MRPRFPPSLSASSPTRLPGDSSLRDRSRRVHGAGVPGFGQPGGKPCQKTARPGGVAGGRRLHGRGGGLRPPLTPHATRLHPAARACCSRRVGRTWMRHRSTRPPAGPPSHLGITKRHGSVALDRAMPGAVAVTIHGSSTRQRRDRESPNRADRPEPRPRLSRSVSVQGETRSPDGLRPEVKHHSGFPRPSASCATLPSSTSRWRPKVGRRRFRRSSPCCCTPARYSRAGSATVWPGPPLRIRGTPRRRGPRRRATGLPA